MAFASTEIISRFLVESYFKWPFKITSFRYKNHARSESFPDLLIIMHLVWPDFISKLKKKIITRLTVR